jgi:UDP-GlcNAc:undecaprenyl-phosphate/decaprenyl-phosphate GlcNAc-1-phosphate transferase
MTPVELMLPAATCAAVVAACRPHASALGLVAKSGVRHRHDGIVPVVGGIGIVVGILATWAFLSGSTISAVAMACAVGVAVMGLLDDRAEVPASRKLLAQCVLAGIAAMFGGLALPSLGQWLPGLVATVPALAIPMAVIGIVAVMNAMNMADGVDGLAGTIAAGAFLWLAVAASLGGAGIYEVGLSLSAVAALVAFLGFNARWFGRARAAVFMGDAGSLFIGFLLAAVAIHYSQVLRAVPPAVAFWICAVPLLDGLVVIVRRRLAGSRAMAPDCSHLHHRLLRRGHSVNTVVALEGGMSFAFGGIAVAAWRAGLPHWIMIVAIPFAAAAWWAWTGWLVRAPDVPPNRVAADVPQ